MAVSLAQYVDLLVKKLYGVAKTDDAANKSPSNESIPSPPLLRGDIVWTQSDQIANTAQVTSGITQSYLGTGTIQCSPDTTTVPIGGIYPTWLTGLTNWIPQEFGSTWPVKVYVDTTGAANAQATGTQIFSPGIAGVGEFFFDTQAGLLNFIGDTIPTTLTAGKSIFIAGYRYVGLLGTTHLPGNTTIGNLVIANTTITTNQTNGNVIIAATGNGYAQIAGTAGIAIPYGNTNQRPHTPLEGTIRYNSVDLVVEVYTGNAWATVGSGGGNNTYNISSQTISSADGSAVTFTLDQVTETENILVSINGIGQSPTINYTVAADQLTFSEAPQPSDIIEIRFISPAPAAGTVTSGTQYHIPYYANTGSTVSDSGGNLNWNGTNLLTVRGAITATGNITGNYILGNGSQLTGIAGAYGNANVANYLPTFSGNLTAGNISASGNVTGNYILGNIAFANGIPATYGNSNVANYLPTYSGNITAGNVSVTGNVYGNNFIITVTETVTGNVTAGNILTGGLVSATGNITGNFILGNGSQLTGLPATYGNANVANYLPTFSGNLTAGNISASGNIAGNFILGNIAFANGIPATYSNANVQAYAETGWAGNIVPSANVTYTLGNSTNWWANAWFGSNTIYIGGVALSQSNGSLSFNGNAVVTANASGTSTTTGNVSIVGNVSASYVLGNGSQLTGIVSSYSNANVANYLPTYSGNLTAGNVSTTGNITGNYILGNGSQLTGLSATYGNTNVATFMSAFGSNTISTSGNITAGRFIGNGSALTSITGANVTGTVANATYATSAGSATTATSATTAATVTTAAQPNITSVGILSSVSVTSNITGGNILTGGLISSTGNITSGNISATAHTGTTISITGNVTAGNVINTGISSVTGNISGGNIATAGQVSATGNITTANYFVGNIVGTTVSTTGNVYAGNVIVNGQPTTYGYVNGAYLLAQNTTDQSVGLNVAVNFQTTSASNGSIITKTSNSQVTLTAGNTYKLEGIIRRLSSSSTWAVFRWYDVTNSAYVGIEGFSEVTNSPGAIGSTNVATYIVTPTVNTIYELRQTTVNTISVSGGYAGYEITQINPAIAVQATATGTINNQYASITNNTDISITNGVAKDVTFDTVTASSGIPYSTSTGVFTLTSGVTYRFTGEISFAGYTGYALYQLVDATTNTPINGQIATCPSYNSGFTEANNNTYDAIYTPSTNQTVKFRVTGSSFTGTGVIRGGYYGRINVQQINNAFALNALDTISTTGNVSVGGNLAVTGNIAGTAVKITAPTFQAVTPDWTLSDSASATYFLLGTWNTSQAGNTLYMRMVAHVGYNAIAIENQVTELMFATSNGSAYTTGSSGNFYGNGLASINSRLGTGGTAPTYKAPQTFRIIQVSNTQYQIYCYFAAAYMRNSTYSIQISSGDTWVDGGGGAVSAPSGNYITITPTAF